MTRPRVHYWMANYAPEWEAVSKELATLLDGVADTVDGSLVSIDTRSRRFQLQGRVKRVPVPLGLPLYALLRRHAGRAALNHFFGSAAERRLTPILAGYNGILTVAKGLGHFAAVERNAPVLRRYRAVVTQSERDRDLLRQLGVPQQSVHLIRPGIPLAPYREAQGPFTILFASSPFAADEFITRGIYLMVRAAARLPDVRFRLVWRRHHVGKLRRLVQEAGCPNVEIHDGVVPDMRTMYDAAHAAILPALDYAGFVPAPRSGLEALAHGKPLLASCFMAFAESLAQAGAGVVFDPTADALADAVRRLQRDYAAVQARTQGYIADRYSPERHLELHRQLYRSLLG